MESMCVPVAVTTGAASSSGALTVFVGQMVALITIAGVFVGNLWKSLKERKSREK